MEIVVQCSECDFETTIEWPESSDGKLIFKSILHPSSDPGSEALYDHHWRTRPVIHGASGHSPYYTTINDQKEEIEVNEETAWLGDW